MSLRDLSVIELFENSILYHVAIIGKEGHLVYVNRKHKKNFNKTYDDLVGQHYSITVHNEDIKVCENMRDKCINQPGSTFNSTIRHHDGKGSFLLINWEYRGLIAMSGEFRGIFCIGYDVSEFEKENKILLNVLEKVDQQQYRLNEIAFQHSHIIRKPLANILGLASVLKWYKVEPDIKEIIDHITSSIKELDEALNSI